jgi:phage terminase large subunit-like protein
VDWIEDHLVYGPGELKGVPYKVEPEFKALIWRMYEVYPEGHKLEGRRRFKRATLSLRKGTAKTEKGAILAIAEAHPLAPVRCDGFDAYGEPVGVGVASPYIPLVAFSQDQTEDLAYGVVRQILEECELGNDFDIGLERIKVINAAGRESGKIVPLGGSPNARDGARTTFQYVDESHRLYHDRLKKAHQVMLQNVYKRVGADAWTLETTTAFDPGQSSVAEETYHYAKKIASGDVQDTRLFYFHRQAPDDAPLAEKEDIRAALMEASGPAAAWSGDIDALVDHWFEPNTDQTYYRRVWLNQPVAGSGKAFRREKWDALGDPTKRAEPGAVITLGFDGARRRDATSLVAVDVEQSFMWPIQTWVRPEHADEDWEIPSEEVDAAVEMAFETWDVWRMYGDPPYWDDRLDAWAGVYGDKRVIKWWTNRQRAMANAVRSFHGAMRAGVFTHDGDPTLSDHIYNAYRQDLNIRDEDDRPLWVIRKERPHSPLKIDASMAAILAWEAAGDCLAAGVPRSRKNKTLVTF